MSKLQTGITIAASALLAGSCASPSGRSACQPVATDRVVCLGDSITDGHTYGQILIQSLREAGKPVPTVICAGVASDTAPQMAARLERTVLVFKPQWVTFSAGANDALREVTPAQYEAALREIVAKVRARGARLILLTPCALLKRDGKTPAEQEAHGKRVQGRLDEFEKIIRTVAAENGGTVAENRALMAAAMQAGQIILAPDNVHPNYAGQALMARSILDAMGYRDVALPQTFEPRLFPGIIPEWKVRLAPLDDKKQPVRLTTATAGELKPDDTWLTYTLPDPVPTNAPSAGDWNEQIRRNGFALKLQERLGAGMVQAVADVNTDREKHAYVQVGGGVASVWLNGLRIHDQGTAWTGFHAGKERLPISLVPGRNRLVVETGGQHFFLAVTDGMVWEDGLR
jgi:lysophospholipase L1-like esterase